MFRKIKMSFLPVGHTHEDIDQVFSRISVALNKGPAYTWEAFMELLKTSFVKDQKRPNIVPVGHAYAFKRWLEDRPCAVGSWSDNLCFRFSRGHDDRVQMHYKPFCCSPSYFGQNAGKNVASFKRLARMDPAEAAQYAGIAMAEGVPAGEPQLAKNLDFTLPETAMKAQK